jgi:murein DD-endopeptidase MepM/ murein hydrolase activator NlpD
VRQLFPILALLASFSQPALALPGPAGLTLPVSPTCITSPFGPRRRIGQIAPGLHPGIDLSAPAGGAIRAAADGQVIAIHKKGIGGLEMLIQHGDPKAGGYVTLYSHLGMLVPAIAEGKRHVAAGEKIAVVGRTGVTYGTHLYFGLLLNGRPIDPEPFLPVKRCGT